MKQRLLVAAIGVPLLILVLVFLPPVATGILVAAIAGAVGFGGELAPESQICICHSADEDRRLFISGGVL